MRYAIAVGVFVGTFFLGLNVFDSAVNAMLAGLLLAGTTEAVLREAPKR